MNRRLGEIWRSLEMNANNIDRRDAVKGIAAMALGGWVAELGEVRATAPSRTLSNRPHIFITSERIKGLRSIAGVRSAIESGISKDIWEQIRAECDRERGAPVLTARTLVEGRAEATAQQNNPDYTICKAAGQRILRNALAMLLTEEEVYKKTALGQIAALVDESVWPDWIDQAHIRFGHPADLRTGMLSQDVGIGFDWLYPFLSTNERREIVEGLDRRGIQPFFDSVEQDAWWTKDLNNWYTVIIGGLGIAGMALGEDHPRSDELVQLSLPMMERYLEIYGKDGEFNESIAYSNATRIPVAYFQAYSYHNYSGRSPLAKRPFPQTGEWTVFSTLPPGRYAAFGDGWIGVPPEVEFMTAIASATRDPVLQGFCRRYLEANSNPFLLLWHDPEIDAAEPGERLPLGRVFNDNGAQVFSRSDWDLEKPEMIVYGKAKRDHNHAHNDVGQLCIDTLGKRMIVDLGSPSAYPADFFDENRWRYYNASILGHNVPMFGGREQRSPSHKRGVKMGIDFSDVSGRYLQSDFDDAVGGYWQMDLSAAYEGVVSVKRTVVHLFPGVAVALDEGELQRSEKISLRWHTIHAAKPDSEGAFRVEDGQNGLDCRVSVLSGNVLGHELRHHEYVEPFHRDRTGVLLEQRHEPYVETLLNDDRYRVLTLFASNENTLPGNRWERYGDLWKIRCKNYDIRVEVTQNQLVVSNDSLLRSFRVRI